MRLGQNYLAFLHVVQHHTGRSMYRVAAYTFDARPPFAITSVSPPFLLAGRGTPYPIGLVASKRHLLLSYGADDSEWCARLPLSSERDVSTSQPATTPTGSLSNLKRITIVYSPVLTDKPKLSPVKIGTPFKSED